MWQMQPTCLSVYTPSYLHATHTHMLATHCMSACHTHPHDCMSYPPTHTHHLPWPQEFDGQEAVVLPPTAQAGMPSPVPQPGWHAAVTW